MHNPKPIALILVKLALLISNVRIWYYPISTQFRKCNLNKMASLLVPRLVSLLGLIAFAIAGAAFFVAWDDIKISLNYIKTGKGTKNDDENYKWFSGISIIFCGILCAVIAIYELFLAINPMKFKFYSYGLFRTISYTYIGISVLGVSGDLGISACAFCLLAAIVNFTILIGLFCECCSFTESNTSYVKATNNVDSGNADEKV